MAIIRAIVDEGMAKSRNQRLRRDPKGAFISWTGPAGRDLAKCLRSFLRGLFPDARFFVSGDDIPPGDRWRESLERALREYSCGILVLTPAAVRSPWLLFEAGALSARRGNQLVPLLFDVPDGELVEPLSAFQAISHSKDGAMRLVQRIAHRLSGRGQQKARRIGAGEVPAGFDKAWRKFEAEVKSALRGAPGPARSKEERLIIGDYVHYALKLYDPKQPPQELIVHRGCLSLTVSNGGERVARFQNHYSNGESSYSGEWRLGKGHVHVDLQSGLGHDRLFFGLRVIESRWMWGVYCGVSTTHESVAGRSFLVKRHGAGDEPAIAKLLGFIRMPEADLESNDARLEMSVCDYLREPVGAIIKCRTPVQPG